MQWPWSYFKKKLAKHVIYRTSNIPALHLFKLDHFAHPRFSCSNRSPSFLLLKYSPQAVLSEHVTCLSCIFETRHLSVDACVLHSPGQK